MGRLVGGAGNVGRWDATSNGMLGRDAGTCRRGWERDPRKPYI